MVRRRQSFGKDLADQSSNNSGEAAPVETQDNESDDSMKWEDFFGSSLDLTSAILDMYDFSVKEAQEPAAKTIGEPQALPPSPKGPLSGNNGSSNVASHSRHRLHPPPGSKLHLSLSPIQNICNRPLSSSSLSSSSSSSSSSSLPRRDSKKLYLASIESLDDDFSEDCTGRVSISSRDHSPSNQTRTKLDVPFQGNFSSHSVGSVSLQTSGSRDSSLSHTDRVILEIVETERTYVQDLQEIIENYLHHIQRSVSPKVDSKSLSELFSNIEDILKFNRTFLQDLEMCGLDSVAVARCFFKHSYGFAIYTQYCTNYPRTVSILTELMRNSETAEVFKERQIALHHNLPLGSYLLKPVQRILRYRLLLENIVKTSNKDCEGYADIKNALSVMTGIAYHINDMKKRHENAVRVQEIQSLLYGWDGQDLTTYGELVAEGAFRMYRTKTLRHLFLFDKMLLIAKKKEEGILCYKTHIMCSNLMLIESIQGEPICFHVIPFDNPREQHTFQARNVEQKREWCLQLKRVILENYNAVIPSHARQLVMELGQSKQEGSVHLDKSSSKRQLSAPEYLERRKQERRKSESSIKSFKVKKGLKKVETEISKSSPNNQRHEHQSLSASYDSSVNNTKEVPRLHYRWRRASVDVIPRKIEVIKSEPRKKFKFPVNEDAPASDSEKRSSMRFPFHFRGNHPEKNRTSFACKETKHFPEETTDTENEDLCDKTNSCLLDYRPPPHTLSFSEEISDRVNDVGGEYVTFYFANSHARRNRQFEMVTPVITIENNYDDGYCTLSPQMFLPEPTANVCSLTNSLINTSSDSSCSSSSNANLKQDIQISTDYDNLVDLWTKLGTVQINNNEMYYTDESTASSPAIRRVNSFALKEKSNKDLHFSTTKEAFDILTVETRSNKELGSNLHDDSNDYSQLPFNNTKGNFITSLLQEQPTQSYQKSVSLPWSFHIGKQMHSCSSNLQETAYLPDTEKLIPDIINAVDNCSISGDTVQTSHQNDHSQDFVGDFEKYIKNTPGKKNNLPFPVAKEFSYENISSRGSTVYASNNSVNSVHPNHKIYQEVSKHSSVKNILSNVSTKLTAMKASCENSFTESSTGCKADILEENTSKASDAKLVASKFVHSLGKAYSAMIRSRQKNSKSEKTFKIQTPGNVQKSSSIIGARVAYPLDSEYCLIGNFLPLRRNKEKQINSRPDSLLSVSSNITSSTDSDKLFSSSDLLHFSYENLSDTLPGISRNAEDKINYLSSESSVHSQSTHSSVLSLFSVPRATPTNSSMAEFKMPESILDSTTQSFQTGIFAEKSSCTEHVNTPLVPVPSLDSSSENSDVSGDSYYEKTFEAIENALAEEMFRDSAIYSDPDEIELGALAREVHITSEVVCQNGDIGASEQTENLLAGTNSMPILQERIQTGKDSYNSTENHPNVDLLFIQRSNENVINRQLCLEENQNCQKTMVLEPSLLQGLKSVRRRWKEMEQCQGSSTGISTAEPIKDIHADNCYNELIENSSIYNECNQPKGKGWVKHVVSKLQKENS